MSESQENPTTLDPWVTYRPDVKVLDCTIRDGGLVNDHRFEDSLVKGVYDACVAGGVDYMEFGYKASKKQFNTEDFGPWKFCDEADLRRIVGDNPTDLKLCVMADVERTDYDVDILPKDESVIDLIRVACYISQIPGAMAMMEDAHNKGYKTTLNLMAVSTTQEKELETALQVVAGSGTDAVYVVDSFGAIFSDGIRELVGMFRENLESQGVEVGIHAHNNQQLAYANTLEAMINGATWLDATINGIGRGAGNCCMELLLGFLKNPKFHQRPILECIQHHLLPLRQDLEWGYQLAYSLTGQLNQHPRAAIKWRGGPQADDILAFYDLLNEEE